jgi:hypothetical protein
MSAKSLRHWAELYLSACAYAINYKVELTLTQFAAAHCLDSTELEELRGYIEDSGVRL